MNENEKWEWYDKVLVPKVESALKKLGSGDLYYEVWYDLEECFDTLFGEYVFNYTNLAAYNIARWMMKRDKWYWSPEYVKALNAATEKYGAASAFDEVLNDSLKK